MAVDARGETASEVPVPVAAEGGHGAPDRLGSADRRPMWATAAVVATYVALAVVVYWNAWSTDVTTHMQLGADQYANVWFLRWIPFAVLHGLNPLFTTWANYPFGVNLVTNTSSPLLGVLGMPVTLAFGSIATFNVLSTLALAGSATAGYAVARRWTTWRPAAWVGGLFYGFSPYQIGQATGHLNLTFVVLPPLILLALHEVVVRQAWSPRRAGVTLGLLVTAQFFVSSEILASTVVMGAVCLVTVAVIGRRSLAARLHRAVLGLVWAVGVAGVLLAYPVWCAARGPGSVSGPIQLVPEAYRADLLGLVYPGAFMRIAPASLTRTSATFANSIVENGSDLGVTLVVTGVVSAVVLWRRSVPVRVAAIGGGVAWILSLGGALVVRSAPGALTGFPLPERLFTHLPLLSNAIPVRYALYVALFASMILAVALDALHRRVVARARAGWLRTPLGSAMAPGVLAALCLVPVIPAIPLSGFADPGIPAYFDSPSLQRVPVGSVALLYPFPSSANSEGELWQASADFWFKMTGSNFLVPQPPGRAIAYNPAIGYGADTITSRTLVALAAGMPPAETPALHAALVAQLRGWHVQTVLASTVGLTHPVQSVQFLTWLAGERPTPDGGVLVWRHFLG